MRLVAADACYCDNRVWFVDRDINGLFQITGKSGTYEEVCTLPRVSSTLYPYSCIVACCGKLVCVPGQAYMISVYNIKEERIVSIPLWELQYKANVSVLPGECGCFEAAVAYKNFVYMFGGSYGCILKLNVETYEMEVFWEACQRLYEFKTEEGGYNSFFAKDIVVEKDIVWLTSYIADAVVEYHLNDDTYFIHRLGYSKTGYSGICYGGTDGDFWLVLQNQGTLILWNKDSNTIKKRVALEQGDISLNPVRLLYGFGNVYVLMQNCPKAYIYSMQRDTVRSRTLVGSTEEDLKYQRYAFAYIFNEKIYISAADTCAIYVFNQAFAQTREIVWNIDADRKDPPLLIKAQVLKNKKYFDVNIDVGNKINKDFGYDIYQYIKSH